MPLPLDGVRVLDLSRLLPGPFATMILGDLGAEVVKIEEPGRGDYTRWNRVRIGGTSAYFLAINRGKKSVALDLKRPAARDALLRLARSADVFVETFRPGVMDRLGAGWEAVRAANPRIVYCSLTGYGQTGPYRDIPGHDNNYLGYSGLLSLTGERDGPPRLLGTQVADLGGAQTAAIAILAALRHRDRTGEGQHLDAALLDAGLFWMNMYLANRGVSGRNPGRARERLNGGIPGYNLYETKDGRHLAVGALEEKFWRRLLELIGRTDLLALEAQPQDDPAYDRLCAALAETFRTRTMAEWLAILQMEEVCVGPVLEADEAARDPQVVARGLVHRQRFPGGEELPIVPFPVKFSATPLGTPARAPALGEHTEETLRAAGLSTAEIDDLRAEPPDV